MQQINIPPTYLEFFVRNHNKNRYVLLQGGRRSGKTFSTLQWLYFLCSGYEAYNVMIAAASANQLQATIQDAQDCLGIKVIGNKVYGESCTLPNGSIWSFRNFDEYTKCVGQKADYLFLNEAVNLDEKSFGTLVQGIRKSIFLNYNPTRACWVDKYVNQDKSNLLITTWKDNPYLTEYQKEEFENIKKRALGPNATIFDKYAYQVFFLGEFANMSGKVFRQVYTISDEEFANIPEEAAYAIDFGLVDSGDQTAMVAVKIHNNCIYAKELLYSKHLANDRDLAKKLHEMGFSYYTTISCDYGSLGRTRINNLRTAGNGEWDDDPDIRDGFDVINCIKHKVVDDIQRMLQYDKIYVTESSYNLRLEMDNYELTDEGKPKGSDHCIDACRYAFNYARVNILY